MKNSEQFLSYYNKIDNFLKNEINEYRHMNFYSLIDEIQKKNKIIYRYSRELKRYGDLRNAIVHGRKDGHIIAEPNDYAVNELKTIYEKIESPKLIFDVCRHSVLSMQKKDKFTDALLEMNNNNFSQIPIYNEEKYYGMLNSEMISFWLKSNIDEDLISIADTKIENVMLDLNETHKTIFKAKDISAIEALEIYKEFSESKCIIDAIIITHSGKKDEKPLTIVTKYDIPNLLDVI